MKNLIIKKLEEIDRISRKRWLSNFSESEVWNGHLERTELLLEKQLDELKEKFPSSFKEGIQEANVKKYYISRNHHNDKVGLDTDLTPEGGGVIAQSNSFEQTEKIAKEVYGINKYFIY